MTLIEALITTAVGYSIITVGFVIGYFVGYEKGKKECKL